MDVQKRKLIWKYRLWSVLSAGKFNIQILFRNVFNLIFWTFHIKILLTKDVIWFSAMLFHLFWSKSGSCCLWRNHWANISKKIILCSRNGWRSIQISSFSNQWMVYVKCLISCVTWYTLFQITFIFRLYS